MKKPLAILLITALVLMTIPYAQAGDRDWAAAGKILAGVTGLTILANALSNTCQTTYIERTPHYAYGSKVYSSQWIPGHYEITEERAWVPAKTCLVFAEPRYRTHHGYHRYQTFPSHHRRNRRKRY